MVAIDLKSPEWQERAVDLFDIVCGFIPRTDDIHTAFLELAESLKISPDETGIRRLSRDLRTKIEWIPTIQDSQTEADLQNHLAKITNILVPIHTFLCKAASGLSNLCIDPQNSNLIGFNYNKQSCVYDRNKAVLYSTSDPEIDMLDFLKDPITSPDTLKITYLDKSVVTRKGKNGPLEFRAGDRFSIESINRYISQINGYHISPKSLPLAALKEVTLSDDNTLGHILFEYNDGNALPIEIEYHGPLSFIPQNKQFNFEFEKGKLSVRQKTQPSIKEILELDNRQPLQGLIDTAKQDRLLDRLNLLKIGFDGQVELVPRPLRALFDSFEESEGRFSVDDFFWRLDDLIQTGASKASDESCAKWRIRFAQISSFFQTLEEDGWKFSNVPDSDYLKVENAERARALFDPRRQVAYIWPTERIFSHGSDFTRPLKNSGEIYIVNKDGLSLRRLIADNLTPFSFNNTSIRIDEIRDFILSQSDNSSNPLLDALMPQSAVVKSGFLTGNYLHLTLNLGNPDAVLVYNGPVVFTPGDGKVTFQCDKADVHIDIYPSPSSSKAKPQTVFNSIKFRSDDDF